eukprot:Skav201549  [mRNA]  locus=scaffold1616:246879:254674:+ [translate_table: standard]
MRLASQHLIAQRAGVTLEVHPEVEISSLQRAVQSGLERLDGPQVSAAHRPPWQLLVSQTAPASAGLLKADVRGTSRRDPSFEEGGGCVVRARRKSMRAEQKGVVLDGKQMPWRRISVLEVDLERQQKQSQKDLQDQLTSEELGAAMRSAFTIAHREEEALAAQQREQLEDIARSERQTEAALEICRKDMRVGPHASALMLQIYCKVARTTPPCISHSSHDPQELALAQGVNPKGAKEQGALAAAEVRSQTGSLAERQAALKRTIAIREELIYKTQQMQEEYEAEKQHKDAMMLERIDLELEMESEKRIWEKNLLDRKRMVQPGVTQPGVSSVDLVCLRSELTVQKEMTEQEVAQSSLEAAACTSASALPHKARECPESQHAPHRHT